MERRFSSTAGRFTRKVLIEGPFGHRRFAGESFDTGRVDALAIEQVGGRIEDALSCAAPAASIGGPYLTLGGHKPKDTDRFTSCAKTCSVAHHQVHQSVYKEWM